MADNDLIRRSDALAEIEFYRMDYTDARDAIAALPAVQPTVSPDVAALVEVIRVQTGLIRAGCGGAQHRLNICCDRIDAALARVKGVM